MKIRGKPLQQRVPAVPVAPEEGTTQRPHPATRALRPAYAAITRKAANPQPAQRRAALRAEKNPRRKRPHLEKNLPNRNKKSMEDHFLLVFYWCLRASYCYNCSARAICKLIARNGKPNQRQR
jgi:hypothetical protein